MGGGGQSGTSASAGTSAALAPPPMGGFSASQDLMAQWRQLGAAVPFGELADIRVTTRPAELIPDAMIDPCATYSCIATFVAVLWLALIRGTG
jgi:hypothetical protein